MTIAPKFSIVLAMFSLPRYGSMTSQGVAIFSLLLSFASTSNALEIACPQKILTTQTLETQEAGWREFVRPDKLDENGNVNAYSHVSRISVYSDNPKKLVELKPDNELARDPTWSFLKASPDAPPLYMACNYFDTRIQFVRELPANVKKCVQKRGGVLQCEIFKH